MGGKSKAVGLVHFLMPSSKLDPTTQPQTRQTALLLVISTQLLLWIAVKKEASVLILSATCWQTTVRR